MDRTIDQLCYFAALTRSGLTGEVLRNVVSFICAQSSSSATTEDIQKVLREKFNLQQPLAAIQAAADDAVAGGWLTHEGLKYGATLSGRSLLADFRTRFDNLEATVRSQWIQVAEDVFGNLEEVDLLWRGVRAQLAVLVFRHGSSTASLLSDEANLQPAIDGLQAELTEAAQEQCDGFGKEIVLASLACFFELDTAESAEFVGHLLSSAFSYSALTIAPEAAKYLSDSLKPLDIFLDTNFIFGLLEWHDSPQNKVCQELVRITKENKLPFKFYFFEDTLKELTDWLTAQVGRWLAGPFAPGVSRALSTTDGVPLFVRRYHEENAKEPLDVSMYLDRFLNIGAQLEGLGLTLFREPEQNAEDVLVWGERQAAYEEFLRSRPKWKERTNTSLRHDSVLLGIVDRRRVPGASPLTSGCLLLTVDSHLIAFSRDRNSARGDRSLALYPSQLMQLVMPFIVQTEVSARVLAESINISVFQALPFDRERAVSTISKFIRNIKNLTDVDAKRILCDQILLVKLSLSSDDEAAELVESALAKQTAEARKKQAEAEAELERVQVEREGLADRLIKQRSESSDLAKQLTSETAEKTELGKTVDELALKVRSLEEAQASQRSKNLRSRELAFGGVSLLTGIASWFLPLERAQFLAHHANLLQMRLAFLAGFALVGLGQFVPRLRPWVWGVVFADVLFGLWFAIGAK